MGIVITRPLPAARALAEDLAREGATPFVFPALEIEPIAPGPSSLAALQALPHAAFAIFVSANAVAQGLPLAQRVGAWPATLRAAAVGEATADALRQAGIAGVLSPGGRQDSEGLLALPALQSVAGATIVIFRGLGGREHLRATLESRGAKVAYVECYARRRPEADARAVRAAGERGDIHAVSALSAETLDNFLAMVGDAARPWLSKTTLVVSHPAVAAHASARCFARAVVAPADAKGIAQALAPSHSEP
jgi:uroporphyrinogen-III synthase